jgi:hypothetical protein
MHAFLPWLTSSASGLNGVRIFGVDVNAKRNEILSDYPSRIKMRYLKEGADPSYHWYGWVAA